MRYTVITLFPNLVRPWLEESLLKKALERGLIRVEVVDLRAFGLGRHRTVDDTPYGGGAGMVLRVDVLAAAIDHAKGLNPDAPVLAMTPRGKPLSQARVRELAAGPGVTVLCADRPLTCGVAVMGGAPGTRETDLLAPDTAAGVAALERVWDPRESKEQMVLGALARAVVAAALASPAGGGPGAWAGWAATRCMSASEDRRDNPPAAAPPGAASSCSGPSAPPAGEGVGRAACSSCIAR